MSKQIELSQGKIAIVDDEDFEYINKWKWCATKRYNGSFYAISTDNKKSVYMHRIIMNPPDGVYVDHINRDSLDNRKCNLRYATNSQNQMNTTAKKNSSTKVKGVFRYGDKFSSQISYDGKRVFLGHFSTIEEAKKAYDLAAQKLHNEFKPK